MARITDLPRAVRDYQQTGGVLEFVAFADADGTETAARDAIGQALDQLWGAGPSAPDLAHLPDLVGRVLARDAFLGDWVEPASGTLRRSGTCTMSDGRTLTNPPFWALDVLAQAGVTVVSSATEVPALWEGGQFGFAFADPPYSLRATPGRVAALFDAVRDWLLPPGKECVVRDWAGPEMVALCPGYFEPGTEWWGVFLWTVQVVDERRLTVILGASTD